MTGGEFCGSNCVLSAMKLRCCLVRISQEAAGNSVVKVDQPVARQTECLLTHTNQIATVSTWQICDVCFVILLEAARTAAEAKSLKRRKQGSLPCNGLWRERRTAPETRHAWVQSPRILDTLVLDANSQGSMLCETLLEIKLFLLPSPEEKRILHRSFQATTR